MNKNSLGAIFLKSAKSLYKRWYRWRYPSKGVQLKNELLNAMVKLNLAPYWVELSNGARIGIGFHTPRQLFKLYPEMLD